MPDISVDTGVYHLDQCPLCHAKVRDSKEDIEQLVDRFIPCGITKLRLHVVEDYQCQNCKVVCQYSYELNTGSFFASKIVVKEDKSKQEKLLL